MHSWPGARPTFELNEKPTRPHADHNSTPEESLPLPSNSCDQSCSRESMVVVEESSSKSSVSFSANSSPRMTLGTLGLF